MGNRNLQELPKFSGRWSHLYLEKGHIEQYNKAVAYKYLDKTIPLPIESLSLLLLGPGTTITHEAIKRLADCRCLLGWTGENGVRFYSVGSAGTYSARNLLRQAELFSNPEKRLLVCRKMYQKRFPEVLGPDLSIEQLRGKEGYRVRQTYQHYSQKFNIEWQGRSYDQTDWKHASPVNRALSAANACLYGICHAAILAAGFSPAIGFIHTGKQLSFVYDISDLYKTNITIPIAFKAARKFEKNCESYVRHKLRDIFRRTRLLKRIIPDIMELMYDGDPDRRLQALPEGRDIAISH